MNERKAGETMLKTILKIEGDQPIEVSTTRIGCLANGPPGVVIYQQQQGFAMELELTLEQVSHLREALRRVLLPSVVQLPAKTFLADRCDRCGDFPIQGIVCHDIPSHLHTATFQKDMGVLCEVCWDREEACSICGVESCTGCEDLGSERLDAGLEPYPLK